MSIFDKRFTFKPFEYPEILEYKNAINHSYWLVSEWNFIGDIHDFNVKLNDVEKHAIRNALLAISQIEVSVKKFWTKLGDRFPKSEFEQVGVTFGESEVRHADAYSHLLEVLGLNDDFAELLENPVIQGRVDYLTKYLKGASENSDQNYTLTLALFSIFIENVSLFSQFVIIKSFNKYMNVLKDIDNVVQATQKEECYADGTDVLTPYGWRSLSDVQVGDCVYQYVDGILEQTAILHKTHGKVNGDMISISNKSSACLVTPNHDMVYINKTGMKKAKAKDISYHSRIKVPAGGVVAGGAVDILSWEDRLRIALQADATTLYWVDADGEKQLRGVENGYTHSIGLTKKRKQDRFRMILNNLAIEYKEEESNKDEIRFKIRYNQNFDYKEFDWVDIIDKSNKWLKDFINETIEWDGHRDKTNVGFSTTNLNVANKVHAIAILAGLRSNLLTHVDSRGYKNTYKVTFSNRTLTPLGHSYKKEIVNYNGDVYCITVPSGIIVTRFNGRVCVAGNCVHALFGACVIKHIQKEYPDWFDDVFYAKLLRACKKAYEAECGIIDWIFEAGELSFLSKDVVKEFVKQRFNDSLQLIGGAQVFDVDADKLQQLKWFNDEIYAEVNTDFFHKKPVTYSKKVQAIKAEDLF